MKNLLYNPALIAPAEIYSLLQLPPRKEESVVCDYSDWEDARMLDLNEAEYAMLIMRYNPKGRPTSLLYVEVFIGRILVSYL